MSGEGRVFVLFYTSAAAFRAEKEAQRAGLPARLVPTPRELSSDCGVSLRFAAGADDPAQAIVDMERLLEAARIPYERIVAQ